MTSSPSLLTTVLLLGGLLPLAAGPFLARWADRSQGTKAALDAFIAVSLAGIVILHLWPHAFLIAGGWALVGGLAGLLVPFLLHGPLHAQERKIYPAMVAIAFLGLAIHATLDGIALLSPILAEPEQRSSQPFGSEVKDDGHADHGYATSDDHAADEHTAEAGHGHADDDADVLSVHDHSHGSAVLLAVAVILHRLPMGVAVWWLVVPILGQRFAIFLLATLAGATVLGFSIAGRILVDLSMPGIAIFEATIAGMLLHVIMGHEHGHGAHAHMHEGPAHEHGHTHEHAPRGRPSHEGRPWISALGALVGAGLVVGLCQVHPIEKRFAQELSFGEAFSALSIYLAPFLLLGAVLEGIFQGMDRVPRALRPEIAVPAALAALGFLGWQWTLLYVLGAAWILSIAWTAAGRRGTRDAPKPELPRRDLWPRVEQAIHRNGVWALVGIGIAALLEPILRFHPSAMFPAPSWMGPGFAWALAALLGILCCRHALLGIILAFFLLHMEWSPATVLCFLFAGVLARSLRRLPVSVGWASVSCLGLVPLVWWAQFIPTDAVVDFHGLADRRGATWQTVALAGLIFSITVSLFLRGFRGFLAPIFGLHAEPSAGDSRPAQQNPPTLGSRFEVSLSGKRND